LLIHENKQELNKYKEKAGELQLEPALERNEEESGIGLTGYSWMVGKQRREDKSQPGRAHQQQTTTKTAHTCTETEAVDRTLPPEGCIL
jgi:hypothetical protein